MIKTFNCGVGFCLIVPKKKCKENSKIFFEKLYPTKLVLFQKVKNRIKLVNSIQW